MDCGTLVSEQLVPIIALPRSLSSEELQTLQHKYGGRYHIVCVGSSLTGRQSPRILVLTDMRADKYESAWDYDWIDYHLACRLLPEGKMFEIIWDARVPGKLIFVPMRRKCEQSLER